MELSLIGTLFLQALDLSYDTEQQDIFPFDPDSPVLSLGATGNWGPYEAWIVKARFLGHVQSFMTQIAIIGSQDFLLIIRGPALTSVDHHGLCQIAITNSTPKKITIPKGIQWEYWNSYR